MSNGASGSNSCACRSRRLRPARSTELGQRGSGRGRGDRRGTLRRRCGRRTRFHRGAACPSGPGADRCLADRGGCRDLCRCRPGHLPRMRRRLLLLPHCPRRHTVATYRCVVVPQRQPGLAEQGHADSGRRCQARGPQHGAHAHPATLDTRGARSLAIVPLRSRSCRARQTLTGKRDSGHRCRASHRRRHRSGSPVSSRVAATRRSSGSFKGRD